MNTQMIYALRVWLRAKSAYYHDFRDDKAAARLIDEELEPLRRALAACELAMDTAALHNLPQQLPPTYRQAWAEAHEQARDVLQSPGEKGTNDTAPSEEKAQ